MKSDCNEIKNTSRNLLSSEKITSFCFANQFQEQLQIYTFRVTRFRSFAMKIDPTRSDFQSLIETLPSLPMLCLKSQQSATNNFFYVAFWRRSQQLKYSKQYTFYIYISRGAAFDIVSHVKNHTVESVLLFLANIKTVANFIDLQVVSQFSFIIKWRYSRLSELHSRGSRGK